MLCLEDKLEYPAICLVLPVSICTTVQARGPAPKRAVTPKVGEEPLNLQEYQAVRQASPSRR